MISSKNRILGFDVARSLAMFYIVGLLHLSGYTEWRFDQYSICTSFIWSTLGVFTFLSAYLLASRYSFNTKKDVIIFFKRRVLRFYPLFFISSVLLLAIGFNTWAETWKGLLGISPFWIPQQHTLWYIATIIFLYLITPIICCRRLGIVLRLLIGFVVIPGCLMILQIIWHRVDPRLFYYLVVYLCGAFAAMYLSKLTRKTLESKYTLFAIIPYTGLLWCVHNLNSRVWMLAAGYCGVILLLNVSMLVGKRISEGSGIEKVISFLSFSSMSAYLFHREIYWIFLKIWSPESPALRFGYLFFIALPVVFYISYWIQIYYDNISKRL